MKNIKIQTIILFLGVSLLYLINSFTVSAAVPDGVATMTIEPATDEYSVSDEINTSVYFNTNDVVINGVSVRLVYPSSELYPDGIVVTRVNIDNELIGSGDWSCPVKSTSSHLSDIIIDIACANVTAVGFSSDSDVKLADIKLQVNSMPQINPTVMRIDPFESIITRKLDGQDILRIPTSNSEFYITPHVTPTPTVIPSPTSAPDLESEAKLYFDHSKRVEKEGFELDVGVESKEALRRVDAIIKYEKEYLQVKGVSRTNLFNGNGYHFYDSARGVIHITQFDDNGFAGNGIIGSIEFEPIKTGKTTIEFSYSGSDMDSRALRYTDLEDILVESEDLDIMVRNPVKFRTIFSKVSDIVKGKK